MICEGSIEHQILHLLGRKQALADGLLDGQGDLGTLKMPSCGRAAMIERIEAMMRAPAAAAPRILPPEEAIAEELRRRHGERALLVEAHTSADSRVRLLAVLDLSADALAAEAKRHEARAEQDPAVEVIDQATWLAVKRLAASGLIALAEGQSRVLHQSPALKAIGASTIWSTVASCPRRAEAALAALPPLRPTGGAHEIDELISLIETGVHAMRRAEPF
jgi:hypothetical protein